MMMMMMMLNTLMTIVPLTPILIIANKRVGDAYKHVDSYNFIRHNIDTFTPMDILQDFDDEYYRTLS